MYAYRPITVSATCSTQQTSVHIGSIETIVLRGETGSSKANNIVFHKCKHTHTHPFNGPFPGLLGWAATRKVKPIWILLKQETVSGSGISWAICKCVPRSGQITMPAPHRSVFTGRMPFLPPNQQRQSTEGTAQMQS